MREREREGGRDRDRERERPSNQEHNDPCPLNPALCWDLKEVLVPPFTESSAQCAKVGEVKHSLPSRGVLGGCPSYYGHTKYHPQLMGKATIMLTESVGGEFRQDSGVSLSLLRDGSTGRLQVWRLLSLWMLLAVGRGLISLPQGRPSVWALLGVSPVSLTTRWPI